MEASSTPMANVGQKERPVRLLVIADEARGGAFLITILRRGLQRDLHDGIADAELNFFGLDGQRRHGVVTQDVDGGFLLVEVHGEFDVVPAASPVCKRALVWTASMATGYRISRPGSCPPKTSGTRPIPAVKAVMSTGARVIGELLAGCAPLHHRSAFSYSP